MRTKSINITLLSSLVVVVFTTSPVLEATQIATYPLHLGKKDQEQLESIACRNKYHVGIGRIDAVGFSKSESADGYAKISCKSHGIFNNKPIYHVIECDRARRIWICKEAKLAITVTVGAHEITIIPDGVSPETANEVVSTLASTKQYKDNSLEYLLGSSCTLHPAGHMYQNPAAVFNLECGGSVVTFSPWCKQFDCPLIISIEQIME